MKIGSAWSSIRGVIRNSFSFSDIKDLVGAAGLPIARLAHMQQKFRGGASKGQLMDAIDGLFSELHEDAQDRFVCGCITESLGRNHRIRPKLERVLSRVGWGLSGDEPFPQGLRVDLETADLSAPIQQSIANCLRRYRDGDASGAITAICGAVDLLTEHYYKECNLGNHRLASYQKRISSSLSTLEDEFKGVLLSADLPEDEANLLWQNFKGAVNQAAYVLGSFRREYSDAHGFQDAPAQIVQRAIDTAVFIIRSLSATEGKYKLS